MMLGSLFEVMMEHSFLMIVFIVDALLILGIVTYIAVRLYKKKRPDKSLMLFFQRFAIKHNVGTPHDIKGLYDFVLAVYVKKGIISRDETGFRAREKIIKDLKGNELKIVSSVFNGFEATKYGGGILNEKEFVSSLVDRIRTL